MNNIKIFRIGTLIWSMIFFAGFSADGIKKGFTKPFETDSDFFPIAVWLQSPSKAEMYSKIGINTYVGLWNGPTDEQIAKLKSSGMKLVCRMNDTAKKYLDDRMILAWMHEDEPDMVRSSGKGLIKDSPLPPSEIIEEYHRIKKIDSSRPVFINFTPAVAVDEWKGRGKRTNHPEDYAEYLKGCDIASFDIYPVTDNKPYISGKLGLLNTGIKRLLKWGQGEKIVWNCIETTRIGNLKKKPTPQQVRAEVWISIISGSRGIIYFVHQFKPAFIEAGLLEDEQMCTEIADINRRVKDLAPVINSPDIKDLVNFDVEQKDSLTVLVKRYKNEIYIFAIPLDNSSVRVKFKLTDFSGRTKITELYENRVLYIDKPEFSDTLTDYSLRIYKISL